MTRQLLKNILLALFISFIIWLIAISVCNSTSSENWMNRVAVALGGKALSGGYIQFASYIVFFIGVLEIRNRFKIIETEMSLFQTKLLPEEETDILKPDGITRLRLKMMNIEKEQGKFLITDLIKKACTKFRANKSVPEVMHTVTRQSQLNFQFADSSQSLIRYLAWALPSIGFIGTILGIAGGIGTVRGKMDIEMIDKVTSLLGVAFDTTLIALLLSIILMYLISILQEKEEKLHNSIEQYVIENLINRIYVPG